MAKGTKIEEVVKELQNLDTKEVFLEIEDGKDTHIEFSLYYSKERKKFSVSVQPLVYKEERGFCSRSYDMFSGTSQYLNDTPIARKSPKQEISARAMITTDLLTSMVVKVGK